MTHTIQFGTSGYRGIISQSFTNKHVDAIAYSIAKYLNQFESPSIIIGYDTRLGNDPHCTPGSYTHTLCSRLVYEGVSVSICDTFTSTPALSWAIKHLGYTGGIMLTASHNPACYNGIKFNGSDGAPAPVTVTEQISTVASDVYNSLEPLQETELITTQTAITDPFVDHLIEMIRNELQLSLDNLNDFPLVVDARFGTSGSTWATLQKKLNLDKLTIVNHIPDPDFGLISPNPSKDTEALFKCTEETGAQLGIAHDPDADRHVIFDEKRQLVSPELLCALFTDFLLSRNIKVHQLLTTLASSGIIRMVAKKNTIQFHETSVGFKYFTPFLKDSAQSQTLSLAVESSGGFSISSHTLEKCGFLPALLTIAIIQETKQPLSVLIQKLEKTYTKFYFLEDAIEFPKSSYRKIRSQLLSVDQSVISDYFDLSSLASVSMNDGIKINFSNNSWILIRGSGTEPVIRIYTESPDSKQHSEELLETAQEFLNKILSS